MSVIFAQQTHRVSFIGINPDTDNIVSIDGCSFGSSSAGIAITTLLSSHSQYWKEQDSDGRWQLCTTKVIGKTMKGSFMISGGMVPKTSYAHPFEIISTGECQSLSMPKSQD